MRFWFDFEFLEDGRTIAPISIGIVSEDDREFYAVFADAPWGLINHDPWLRDNVIPHLSIDGGRIEIGRQPDYVKPSLHIAVEVLQFVGPDPEFWGDYAAYDWVCLCQMYGKMIRLPEGWPMWCRELMQEKERIWGSTPMPAMPGTIEHNSLFDARETRWRHRLLEDRVDDDPSYHPLVYGFRGHQIVYDPDPSDLSVTDRMQRCPSCEQWSPCDVRTDLDTS